VTQTDSLQWIVRRVGPLQLQGVAFLQSAIEFSHQAIPMIERSGLRNRRSKNDWWGYFVDSYRIFLLVVSIAWLSIFLTRILSSDIVLTQDIVLGAGAVLFLWAIRPRFRVPGKDPTLEHIAGTKSRFRMTLIAIMAGGGFLVGLVDPVDFPSVSDHLDPLASAVIFAASAAFIARMYCFLRPITMP